MIDDSRREDFIGIADDLQGVWVVSVMELAFQDICNLGCDTQYHGPLGWGGCPNGRLDCWILFETLPGPVEVRQAMEQNIAASHRSEEHTSELQSLRHLVCRLLLEKKTQT